jgi:glycosyltransferase involved in cell wall biosynthesis
MPETQLTRVSQSGKTYATATGQDIGERTGSVRGSEPWVLVAGGFHQHGAMDKANYALAVYLVSRGHPVHLVANSVAPCLAANPRIAVTLVGRPAGSYFLGDWLLGMRGKAVARQVLAQFPRARVVVNGGNCDWHDINWVHSVHHAWPPRDDYAPLWFKLKNRIDKSIARRRESSALTNSRIVVANSERTRQDLITTLDVPAKRIHTIYFGSDSSMRPIAAADRLGARAWLGKDPDRPLAVFVGALGFDTNKGIDTLVESWRRLCSRPDWDVDLVVAGGGRGVEFWRRRIEQAALSSRVTMLGFTDRVTDLLAAADVMVSPVRYEAYGLNVHEALCRGVPAIVSATAGISERYPVELSGLILHDPSSVDELVECLLSWRAAISSWKESIKPLAAELRARTWNDMAHDFITTVEASGPKPPLAQRL